MEFILDWLCLINYQDYYVKYGCFDNFTKPQNLCLLHLFRYLYPNSQSKWVASPSTLNKLRSD